MKTAAIGIALLALAMSPMLPRGPSARATSFTCGGMSHYVHWSERQNPDDARFAITTEDGEMTLLLTDRDVVFQLSERRFHRVQRELRDAKREQEDNWLASVFVTVVTGTVREVLDHSFVCHVSDLREVRYDDGRLLFIGPHGRAVFGHDDDDDVTRAFSERDARNFVREFQRMKAGD
jgi:hypothetical protein